MNGCAACRHGVSLAPSVSATVSVCNQVYRLLPIYMDETKARPEWCPGFEAKVETGNLKLETGDAPSETTEQQELPL